MQDIYKNIDEYNIGKKRKILIVFYDNVAGMINNKKLNPTVTEFKAKNCTCQLFLLHNHILRCWKILD